MCQTPHILNFFLAMTNNGTFMVRKLNFKRSLEKLFRKSLQNLKHFLSLKNTENIFFNFLGKCCNQKNFSLY